MASRSDRPAATGWKALASRYGYLPVIAAFNILLFALLPSIRFALLDDFMTLYYSSVYRFPADLLRYNGCWPWLYRPAIGLLNYVEYLLFGMDSSLYYATNLALMIVLSVLVYRLLKELCGRGDVALLLALLFASHRYIIVPPTWAAETGNILMLICLVAFLLLALPLNGKGSMSNRRKMAILLLCLLAPMFKETGLIVLGMAFLYFVFLRKDRAMGAACVGLLAVTGVLRLIAVGTSISHPGDDTAFFFDTVVLYQVSGGLLQKLPYIAYTYLANLLAVFLPMFTEKGFPLLVDGMPLLAVDLFNLALYAVLTAIVALNVRRDRVTLFLLVSIVVYCGIMYSEFRFRNLGVPVVLYFALLAIAMGNLRWKERTVRLLMVFLALAVIAQLAYGFVFVRSVCDLRADADLGAMAGEVRQIADSPFLRITPEDREGIVRVIDSYRGQGPAPGG